MKWRVNSTKQFAALIFTMCIALAIAVIASLKTGPVVLSWSELWGVLSFRTVSPEIYDIIVEIRLPRALLAIGVGGGLAVSGVVFQVLLRNVLAEPYILGVSGGASVGALIAVISGLASTVLFALPGFAFAGAVIVVYFVYISGMKKRRSSANGMLLTGIMVGTFLSAVVLLLISTSNDPSKNILYWLIGYLGNARMSAVAFVYAACALCLSWFIIHAQRFNVLALGEEPAYHLGISLRQFENRGYLYSSLLTSVAVSFSGSIGFVGLIVPHVARMIIGPDHRVLIPAAFLGGALFLLIADTISRIILAPVELPVGSITAIIGAPLFIYLLRK